MSFQCAPASPTQYCRMPGSHESAEQTIAPTLTASMWMQEPVGEEEEDEHSGVIGSTLAR